MTTIEEYKDFVQSKTHLAGEFGFAPVYENPAAHDFQAHLIEWSMYTNPGETVLTPFMGVGSEVYSPVYLGRRGIGVELKASYYRQAAKNIACAKRDWDEDGQEDLLARILP